MVANFIEAMAAREERAVRLLGDNIGYGRLMQLAEQIWRTLHPGAELTTGPCGAFMVSCPHTVLDANGHCEICCGAGRITEWVRDNLVVRPVMGSESTPRAKP